MCIVRYIANTLRHNRLGLRIPEPPVSFLSSLSYSTRFGHKGESISGVFVMLAACRQRAVDDAFAWQVACATSAAQIEKHACVANGEAPDVALR